MSKMKISSVKALSLNGRQAHRHLKAKAALAKAFKKKKKRRKAAAWRSWQ